MIARLWCWATYHRLEVIGGVLCCTRCAAFWKAKSAP